MTPKEVLEMAKKNKAVMLDIKFWISPACGSISAAPSTN